MVNLSYLLLLFCAEAYFLDAEAYISYRSHGGGISYTGGGLISRLSSSSSSSSSYSSSGCQTKDNEIEAKEKQIEDLENELQGRRDSLKNIMMAFGGFALNVPSWMSHLPDNIINSAWEYTHNCLEQIPDNPDAIETLLDWNNVLEFLNVQITKAKYDEFQKSHGLSEPFNPGWGYVPGRFLKEYTSVIPFPHYDENFDLSQRWVVGRVLFDVCHEYNDESALISQLHEIVHDLQSEQIEYFFNLMQSDFYKKAFLEGTYKTMCVDPGAKDGIDRDVIKNIQNLAHDVAGINCKPMVFAAYGAAAPNQNMPKQRNPPTHEESRFGPPPYNGGNSRGPPGRH